MENAKTSVIADLIARADEGTLFIPSDFADLGTGDAVRKALSRLVESGELERPIRGVYRKPRPNSFLGRPTVASPDDIARALARKFEWNIAPYGDTALNRLGLDTQVPAVTRYVSDGPYRVYEYGPYSIEFRHTANRDLSRLSPTTATVVQALKALGKDGVTPGKLDAIASKLDDSQIDALVEETGNSTVWIREAVRTMGKRRHRHAEVR